MDLKITKSSYLHNAIDVKAHDQLRYITHQIIQPVINSCENVDWFVVVPVKSKQSEIKIFKHRDSMYSVH